MHGLLTFLYYENILGAEGHLGNGVIQLCFHSEGIVSKSLRPPVIGKAGIRTWVLRLPDGGLCRTASHSDKHLDEPGAFGS